MNDRYRDSSSSKCDRYLPPPHYLAGSSGNNSISGMIVGNCSSIVSNATDTYMNGYLSSTVHTPVKRYVPTTHADVYSESPAQQTQSQSQQSQIASPQQSANGFHHLMANNGVNSQQASANSSRNSSQNSSLSYRYRMKCCANMDACGQATAATQQHHNHQQQQQQQSVSAGTISADDLYATTPRIRQMNAKLSMASQTSNGGNGCGNGSPSVRSSVRNLQNDLTLTDGQSIDYNSISKYSL